MKRFFLLLFALIFVISVFSQTRPPKKVRKAFEENYAGAQDVQWSQSGDRHSEIVYRAEYKLNESQMVTTYNDKSIWKMTVIFIGIDELPETVLKAVDEEFMNAKILRAARFEEPERSSFAVELDYMDSKMVLQLREDGRVIRRRLTADGFEL
jgi:hypothetical protein